MSHRRRGEAADVLVERSSLDRLLLPEVSVIGSSGLALRGRGERVLCIE